MRRAGLTGVAVGLDFGPIMTMGAAQGADVELLSEVLPDVETAIIAALNGDPDMEDE